MAVNIFTRGKRITDCVLLDVDSDDIDIIAGSVSRCKTSNNTPMTRRKAAINNPA
ncbi:hypothetical protein R2S03_10580 [Hafnia alvei]|uniref:hypothetical protein n=1 Tax=Proteus vulgaris TaxID=585 RepID=UPI00299E218F|nr:hypothetical protein [Proteus vulgaris]WOO51575.1 hypothetical protein R2S03_10580 [Hafnia alvei]WPF06048.1 hypothetical protein SB028_09430 [Proteus vulgaris]